MLGGVGRFAYRWRWAVILGWVAVTLAGATLGGRVFDRLKTVDSLRPDAESVVAEHRIDQLAADGETVFAVVRAKDPYDPAVVASVTNTVSEIKQFTGVLDVDDLYGTGGQIGADNRTSLVRVKITKDLPETQREALEDRVSAALHGIDAPQVLVGGEKLAERSFADQAIKDATIGESIALGVLLIALVLILGGPLAAGIPLLVALAAVSTTLLGLLALTAVTTVSEYAVNVVTLLGIGLAVDYSLLLIMRYREEQDVARTVATAGRAVLISGLTVGAALAGLAVFAEPLLAAMALGGALAATSATAISLTLVPALLSRGIKPAKKTKPGLLARLAAYAQSKPGPVAIAVTVGLLLLAAPFLGANLANSDARALPRTSESRQAYEAYQQQFNAGEAAPVTVLAAADPSTNGVRDLLNQLNQTPGVVRLNLRVDIPTTATVIDLTPTGETAGPASRHLVREIRAMRPPFTMSVTGEAAKVVDYQRSVTSRMPVAALVVVIATALLLFALTRSVIIPIKALLLNALTLLATLGLLVVLFQWGLGEQVLRFDSWGGLDLTTPVLLFVFVFGLSTDYEVFLLSRIKEEHDRGESNAVQKGIERSGPVVTAAAICISIVFLGFVLGRLTAVKEIGAGMVIAVLLDVTVVRGLLLPAVMTLLGRWNWWTPALPKMLRRKKPQTRPLAEANLPS